MLSIRGVKLKLVVNLFVNYILYCVFSDMCYEEDEESIDDEEIEDSSPGGYVMLFYLITANLTNNMKMTN